MGITSCQKTPEIIDDDNNMKMPVIIAFAIYKSIKDDESIYLVGNHDNLGNMNELNSIRMNKDEDNVWRVLINLKPNNYTYRFFSSSKNNLDKTNLKSITGYKELKLNYFNYSDDASLYNERMFNVMSFNLRYNTSDDKENAWDFRKESVVNLIMKYRPDIIGTQEGLSSMINYLKQELFLYKYWGKPNTFFGSSCGIFYRKDLFIMIDGGHFWLSDTPETSGSKSFGNDHVRMCSYIKLKYKRQDFFQNDIIVYNTHLDHESQFSRNESSKLIIKKISEFDINRNSLILLTGDFNACPNDSCLSVFRNSNPRLHSANKGNNEETFHDFKGIGYSLIDYIFHNEVLSSDRYEVIKDRNNMDRYPSDHFPIFSRLFVNNFFNRKYNII